MIAQVLALLCVLAAPNANGNSAYHQWRNNGGRWIRVGLKKPDDKIPLYAPGTLLVLDGDKVVGGFKPGPAFWIIYDTKTASGDGTWVQISAAKERSALDRRLTRLKAAYPDASFIVQQKPSGGMFVLRAGPYASHDAADAFRLKMVDEGYHDAFFVRNQDLGGFKWVSDRFDKFDLKAARLGLVRPDPNTPITYDGTRYRGILRFTLTDGNQIRVINELPLETYLRGVVPAEMGPVVFPQLEALKAQAVAARTYAIKNMNWFASRGYDICDGPACQAYGGQTVEHEMSDQAVSLTRDMVLYHEDKLIDALYTSTCGGFTDDVENVFPGRKDPYLRGVSSYQADYKYWNLPPRPTKGRRYKNQDLAVRALIYGVEVLPNLAGPLDPETFQLLMKHLEWVLGPTPVTFPEKRITYHQFWQALTANTFIADTIKHQITPLDLKRLTDAGEYPEDLLGLAAFLLRFEVVGPDEMKTLGNDRPIFRETALAILLDMCRVLGPSMEWKAYQVERFEGNTLHLRRGSVDSEMDIRKIRFYVSNAGERFQFLESPKVEELDFVYRLLPPFSQAVLRHEPRGRVASVDRFSPYNSWVEKKTLAQLEERARRYVRGLRGLKDIKILKRAPTGRVTLMEMTAASGRYEVDGLSIRRSLGIRDNLFDMLPNYQDGSLVHATFVGKGWGHGVGMSQVGAYGLARMGWTYEQILKHYYTDVELRPFIDKSVEGVD